MILDVEHEKSFNLPEGHFRVRFSENRPITKFKDGKAQNYCRLLFEVIEGPHTGKSAGRNFLPSLGKGSQLRDFIETWRGSSFFQIHSANKFDLDTLLGTEGDVLIRHIINGEDIPPFRQVAALYPPGTYVASQNWNGKGVAA